LFSSQTSNGIRVVVNPDPWVSGVAVNLWYEVGSAHEIPGKTGFAHLFEHLMFSGSANVGNGEHLALMQTIGGHCNATTSFDRTNYYETVPRGGLDLALWLEADRLSSLLDSVDIDNLNTQRDVVKEEKRQRYDNVPYGDVFQRIMGLVFPENHPYAHMPIGSMEDLDSASLEDVHSFFHTHYSPQNLILTLAGAIEPDEGFSLVDKYFGHIPPGKKTTDLDLRSLPFLTGIPRLEVSADVPQDVIYCCWLVPPIADDVNDALTLGLTTLSGSMTSRLHDALVKTELADSVDSFDLGLVNGNSVIITTAACADEVSPERLEKELIITLDNFCDEGPTQAELLRAKKAEEREFYSDLANIESRADNISASLSYFGDPEELARHLDIIQSLNTTDIHTSVSTWMRPENRAVMTYRSAR
jgi:predicted Zn-dependent peptidase